MPACPVFERDVVRPTIPGDNGELKPRFSVVMELLSPSKADAVLIIFGCSETKRGASPSRFHRVEYVSSEAKAIGLKNSTTFHLEDTRAYDAASAVLTKRVGKCPLKTFLVLKGLVEKFLAERHPIQMLPRDRASAAAHAAVNTAVAARISAVESID